ncbi:hypothetical protein [Clostridioides difficile]|uniref:hypothetical protein n=1 Tax=Clostridioides difficile TaxID=1496 RepID=UPI000D1F7A2E|nr:hypothetical protein [Clostridioides difficile]HBE9444568.1 hypothetical protein [Clostridioides difficile]
MSTKDYIEEKNINKKNRGVVSIYNFEKNVKNLDALVVGISPDFKFKHKNDLYDESDFEILETFKNNNIEAAFGDCLVCIPNNDSNLAKKEIRYIIGIVLPNWMNGLNRAYYDEILTLGFSNMNYICSDYKIDKIAISILDEKYPYPVIDKNFLYSLVEISNSFKEVCLLKERFTETLKNPKALESLYFICDVMNLCKYLIIQRDTGDFSIDIDKIVSCTEENRSVCKCSTDNCLKEMFDIYNDEYCTSYQNYIINENVNLI